MTLYQLPQLLYCNIIVDNFQIFSPCSSASFNSDLSEVVGGDMNSHALQDTMMMDMDMPMETGENQLSDLFDILKADGTGVFV